jgi:putative ABC transport system permease protein
MGALFDRSLAAQRFFMILLFTFAGVGLALAVVGVYGVMAQLAKRRTREMGIRLALGAQAGQVQWLVVRHGLRLVGWGVALGLASAWAATRTMRALLFEVSPADPVTFLTIPVILGATAFIASWVPALQASRADPTQALRTE